MASNGKRVFGRLDITKALAGGLLILTLIFIVSPAGSLWPLGSWIFMLFGCAGFYFFNAFLLATSLILIIRGKLIKKYFSWMQFLGFIVFLLGVSTLSSTIVLKNPDALSNIIADASKAGAVMYYSDTKVGGGYVGYGLATLLNFGGLNYVLSIAFILLGTGLFLFPELAMIIELISGKVRKDTAIRESRKAMEEEPEQFDDSEFKPIHFGESPTEQVTRIALYSEHANADTYKDESLDSPEETYASGGLYEAKFGDEDDVYEADKYATQFFSTDDFFNDEPNSEPIPAPAPVPTSAPLRSAPAPEPMRTFSPIPPAEEPSIIFSEAEEKKEVVEATFDESETLREIEPTEYISNEPAPAPVPDPIPAPVPTPVEEPEVEEEIPDPNAGQMTQKDQFEARLSLLSPENKIIIRDLHCDFAEELPPYELPPTSLLKTPVGTNDPAKMAADCEVKRGIIDQLFRDMKIGAHVEDYTIGPSVTRFNIVTDPNVRVSSINGVINDLAKRLNGIPPRFQEVVMGSSTSGLEIPNVSSDTVYFKDMIDACGYGEEHKFHIPFGKGIAGDYITGDLRKFPHMLVAGSTGSGKSIFIHGILMSLIMKNRPEELKLILVDPKRVEMALYKDLPHLLCPIIKDVTQVKVCLDKLIDEMERRNMVFEQAGVTNIAQFNDLYAPDNGIAKFPYIVLVLDEFADAVDVCKNISEPVARLAQKARSAGIHIVLTTQRPTVDVVNGRIKANLPTSVALWVRTATDSNVILGQGGAENLAGHGDMLIDCPVINKFALIRAQGCMVWPEETKRVCDFIRKQQKTHYDPVFLDLVDHEAEQKAFEEAAQAAMPSRSELRAAEGASKYELIKEAVMQMEYVSISKIQREFSVGFPRAGKIFKQLQDEGIVAGNEPGQETNSKGSKVLVHAKQQLSGENEGTQNGTRTIPDGWDMPK